MLVIAPMSSVSSDSMPASERLSKLLCLIALAAGLIAGARPVLAETYPAKPVKIILNYAAAGAGTTPDLAAREFARRAGLNLVMVPFKGTHPATTAVITGEVQATFVSIGPYIEFVRNGALRVLAAATREREPYVPDSPTFAEEGFPGFEVSTWFALFAPRGTPDAVAELLNGYTRSVRNDPDAKRRLESDYIDPLSLTAAGFAALVKADAIKWERIVRDTAARLN
jgi:tripartite-type tricarboxylate transporter receptor subunit TctC